jgi:hypothetical protein
MTARREEREFADCKKYEERVDVKGVSTYSDHRREGIASQEILTVSRVIFKVACISHSYSRMTILWIAQF